METCTQEDCDRPVLARSLCRNHYNQRRRDERRVVMLARELVCVVDGTVFHSADPRSIYCSTQCKDRAQNDARQARKVALRPERVCLFCGVVLPREKDGKARYCSKTCQWKATNRKRASALKAARHAAKGPCVVCGAIMPTSRKSNARYCSAKCRNQAQGPSIVVTNRKRLYGIGPEEYAALLEAQGAGCAICRGQSSDGTGLAVDHDHTTGRTRGLLCSSCNNGLGRFRDDPVLLRAAAEYLST